MNNKQKKSKKFLKQQHSYLKQQVQSLAESVQNELETTQIYKMNINNLKDRHGPRYIEVTKLRKQVEK